MHNYLFTSVVFITCLFSCVSKKEYKYGEEMNVEEENGAIEKMAQIRTIKAENDSAGYLEAYKMYCISQKVKSGMLNDHGKACITIEKFSVFTPSGKNITDVGFTDKENRKKEIAHQVSLMSDEQLKDGMTEQ